MQTEWSDFVFFKFLKQSIPDAQPDYWVISILENFWNIMELYPEVNLQFTLSAEIKREIPFSHFILHK